VIHDTLWGTNSYAPHEVAVIDSPLFQRLRYVNQTGLALLTYPSLNHSRFEHSLGMATVASRFLERLNIKYPGLSGQKEMNELRLAALLHDCGHGFLSHVSEEIYRWYPDVIALRRERRFSHAKPSEIFSYLILTSAAFEAFFAEHAAAYDLEADLSTIADLVIGVAPPERLFLAQIVNGALDADKIDYISRDAFYSGVAIAIDLDRLLNDLELYSYPETGLRTLVLSSPLSLERLLFSKTLLYATIYHHQKVKAADSAIENLIEYVRDTGQKLLGFGFEDPIDFLRLSDNDLLTPTRRRGDRVIRTALDRLAYRELPRRSLVLSRQTIENYEGSSYVLHRLAQAPRELRQVRNRIAEELGSSCTVSDIAISLPEQPSLREASQTLAVVPGGGEPIAVNEMFPLEGWLRAYSDNKWRGYVFAPGELQEAVSKAAASVLAELGVHVNALSRTYSHVTADL
jgi:uncharacterized protein